MDNTLDFLREPCKHPLLRSFTFSDGKTIRMCPDCPKFDKKRKGVLRQGVVAQPKLDEAARWDNALNVAGLNQDAGKDWWYTYHGRETRLRPEFYWDGVDWKLMPGKATGVPIPVENDDMESFYQPHSKAPISYIADHDWDMNQSRQHAFHVNAVIDGHDPSGHKYFHRPDSPPPMPRSYNCFCTQCTEVVIVETNTYKFGNPRLGIESTTRRVVRESKGVYMPVDHDCPRVRVYDLQGKLLEVTNE